VSRQFSDDRRHIRLRPKRRHKQFHLALVLVTRTREHVVMIRDRQMRSEQPDRRESEGTLVNQIEDDRKASRGTSGLDSVVCSVLGQMQRLRAIGEERREPFAKIESASVDLHERCE
jgi:hypothetical protein